MKMKRFDPSLEYNEKRLQDLYKKKKNDAEIILQ